MQIESGKQIARAELMAAAAAIAAGSVAYGDPVRFDNDGSFAWGDGSYFDITRGVHAQTGLDTGAGSFQQTLVYHTDPYYLDMYSRATLRGSTPTDQVGWGESTDYVYGVVKNDFGATIPNSRIEGFYQAASFGYYYVLFGGYTSAWKSGLGYAALRFDLDDGTHYGWAALNGRRSSAPDGGFLFDLLAWGYETTPGVSIQAGATPTPGGALALLAIGAGAGLTRQRR